MINEIQFNNIISYSSNNGIKKLKNNNTFFGSPLKRFLCSIYNKLDIPKESFIISLYYLNKFYFLNRNDYNIINNLFKHTKLYIFTSIIISLKFILDNRINVSELCAILNIDYNNYITTELIVLNGLNWNVFLDNEDFVLFKTKLEHYKD